MTFATLIACAVSLCVVILVTPGVRKAALRLGAVDLPGPRKVHDSPTARLGGVAVFTGLLSGTATYVLLTGTRLTLPLVGVSAGAALVMVVGAVDDLKGLSPWIKLGLETLAAAIPPILGLRIEFLSMPFDGLIVFDPVYVTIPLTVLWIVAMANALNLSDGLDGLAPGLAVISGTVVALFSYTQGIVSVTVVSLVVAASSLGFLIFNLHPARIFLGDSGSLMLGYVLGSLSVMGVSKGATFLSLTIPLFIMGFPVVDTLAAIIRRMLRRRPLFTPDKDHLHHRLLATGMPYDHAVYVAYALEVISGGVAIVLGRAPLVYYALAVVALAFLVAMIVQVRHIRDLLSAGPGSYRSDE